MSPGLVGPFSLAAFVATDRLSRLVGRKDDRWR